MVKGFKCITMYRSLFLTALHMHINVLEKTNVVTREDFENVLEQASSKALEKGKQTVSIILNDL